MIWEAVIQSYKKSDAYSHPTFLLFSHPVKMTASGAILVTILCNLIGFCLQLHHSDFHGVSTAVGNAVYLSPAPWNRRSASRTEAGICWPLYRVVPGKSSAWKKGFLP